MSPRRVFIFLLLLVLVFSLFLCNEGRVENKICSSSTPHFVLVHGYTGAAWGWYKIKTLLEAFNYRATCLDLKGAGVDRSDPAKIHSFNAYNKPLIDFFASLSNNDKVILVGHSAGGLSVTDASHRFSDKIKVAVYVAATMLKHGFMTEQDLKDGAPPFATGLAPNGTGATQKPECQTNHVGIYPEDAALGSLLRRPAVPVKTLLDARFKGEKADQVRRVYIKTGCDHTLLPEQQDAMIKRWPPSQVIVVDADHDLIGTEPLKFFGLLVKIATSVDCCESFT